MGRTNLRIDHGHLMTSPTILIVMISHLGFGVTDIIGPKDFDTRGDCSTAANLLVPQIVRGAGVSVAAICFDGWTGQVLSGTSIGQADLK